MASAAERRSALYRAVGSLDQELELAVRAWAKREPIARAACKKVDERRVDYLSQLWRREGKPKRLAALIAELEYAAFLGLAERYGPTHRNQRAAYALLVRALATVDELP